MGPKPEVRYTMKLSFALAACLFAASTVEACPLTEPVYVQPVQAFSAGYGVQSFSAGYVRPVQAFSAGYAVQRFSAGYGVQSFSARYSSPSVIAVAAPPRQLFFRQGFRFGFRGGVDRRADIVIRQRGFGRSSIIIRR